MEASEPAESTTPLHTGSAHLGRLMITAYQISIDNNKVRQGSNPGSLPKDASKPKRVEAKYKVQKHKEHKGKGRNIHTQ